MPGIQPIDVGPTTASMTPAAESRQTAHGRGVASPERWQLRPLYRRQAQRTTPRPTRRRGLRWVVAGLTSGLRSNVRAASWIEC